MAFESPNYTQVPNDLFDDKMSRMGYAELKVVLAVCRYTFGYHQTERRISLTKLEAMTGLTRHSVIQGAMEAENHGHIQRFKDSGVTLWAVRVQRQPVQLENQLVQQLHQTGVATTLPSIKETFKETNLKKIDSTNEKVSAVAEPVTQKTYPKRYNKTDYENMKADDYRRYTRGKYGNYGNH